MSEVQIELQLIEQEIETLYNQSSERGLSLFETQKFALLIKTRNLILEKPTTINKTVSTLSDDELTQLLRVSALEASTESNSPRETDRPSLGAGESALQGERLPAAHLPRLVGSDSQS